MRFARLAALATLASTLVAASVAAQDNQADRVFVTMFVEAVNRGAAWRLPLVHAKARAPAPPAQWASGGT
jgi:hypothetical protein